MSFSGTPLGQGRRLDHSTFLGKPPSTSNRPPSPRRLIPTSYAYGAPTLGSRPPPKPSSEHNTSNIDEDNQDEPALQRYARLKQREQAALTSRPGGPRIITSPPKPDKWSVKDTSVNIATAFIQAASDMQPSTNPNNSWASGSSQPNPSVPRSTSVEYEKESQATITRRLAAPPNRLAPPRSVAGRRPLSKTASQRHVPDSEGEEERPDKNGRGQSPFEQIVDSAKRVLGPVSFYLRQRSQEPGEPSLEMSQSLTNGRESSYDYTAEEQEFQASQQTRRAPNLTHKRGRMSTDNKAYKPSTSDVESSDEDFDDDGKTRRRKKKKKKEPVGGPLTTLPVLAHDKKKKKKSKASRGNVGAEDDESDSDDHATDRQSAQQRTSILRTSAPPSLRQSIPRTSAPPETFNDDPDTSMDALQGLDSIPELDEDILNNLEDQRRSTSRPPSSRPFSIGGLLGSGVHLIVRASKAIGLLFIQCITTILYVIGAILGILFRRPYQWVSRTNLRFFTTLATYTTLALILSLAWYILHDPLLRYIPRLSSEPVYRAPDIPAANIAELAARLQKIENALSGISLDAERAKIKADNEARTHSDLAGRLGVLEGRVTSESKRAVDAEVQFGNAAKEGLRGVRQEVEALHVQLQQQQQLPGKNEGTASDEEARAKLRALEDRVWSVEGGVKEALEVSKKVAGAGTGSSSVSAAWWNKLASGGAFKSGLVIKSSDGQDVTALIGHLVDSAVSTYSKDTLARPDFALHSAGARIIPSLTSPTFEMRPQNLRGQLVGLVTGNGYAIGRPPITALHHELHSGHCWPFVGGEGQLGVALAAPVYIEDVTIDHVAKEVAFDLRSAPREMEVWGMVEGRDNIWRVREWKEAKARRQEEGGKEEVLEEEAYPTTLPRTPQFIRIAKFSYDIHTPKNVQTFSVDQEVRELGVDFGILVLRVKSNWGRDEFTCLYRMRVHGQMMGETPLPYPEEQ